MVLDFCKKLVYHRLEVCISPEKDVCIDGWLGAVIRNNLLYAAEQVTVEGGISLLTVINRLILSEKHPLYASLVGGFPKGFSLVVLSPENIYTSRIFLHKNEKVIFSLVLIGEYIRYYEDFVVAIRNMCERGMGVSMVPWTLHEIYEKDGLGRALRVAVGFSSKVAPLRYPVRLEDFEEEKFGCTEKIIGLYFTAPILLAAQTMKKNKVVSYQDKMNGFPSFYQFVRSAIFRCVKLVALYACPQDEKAYLKAEQEIETYVENAVGVWLRQAELCWVSMRGPGRDDGRLPITLTGYTGKLVFVGDFSDYIPFLAYMQAVGIGNDTVYGLGAYRLKILKISKPDIVV